MNLFLAYALVFIQVGKYNEVQKKVGEKIQSRGAAQQGGAAPGGFNPV